MKKTKQVCVTGSAVLAPLTLAAVVGGESAILKAQWQLLIDALKWHFKLLRTEYSRRSWVGFQRWIQADRAHVRAYLFIVSALAKAGLPSRQPAAPPTVIPPEVYRR
jgi:ferric-dicitrate binding protein FerR (iron transport regulator)